MRGSLPEALERAASALPRDAEAIRPANGDPARLLELLDEQGSVRVLRWLLEHEPEDGSELAAAWAEDPESGAAPLLGIAEGGLPKAGRKALRRAQHQLRSRGLELPRSAAPAVVATLPRVEETLDEALLTPIDPRGTRAAYLLRSHPAGGARLFEVIFDEDRGVLELRVYSAGRGKMRRLLQDFRQRERMAALPAPPEAVRALVQRSAAQQPADRPLPRSFAEWRSEVAGAPEGAAAPGELAREELGPAEATPALLRRAAELVAQGEIGPWPPPADRLQPVAEKVAEAAKGQIIVSGARRREHAESALDEELERVFAAPCDERTARRFEETAWVLQQQGRDEDARACLAAAGAFRQGRPRENPVARAMVDVVLAPFLRKLDEEIEQDEQKSRLVEPGKGAAT